MPKSERLDEELKPEDMLFSLYRVNQRIDLLAGLGASPDFVDLDDEIKGAWAYMFGDLHRFLCEATEDTQYTIAQIAAEANLKFQQAVADRCSNVAIVPWDDIAQPVQLRWKAFVRHMLNAIVFDPAGEDGTLETHEERIALWWQAKVNELNLPEQLAQAQRDLADRAQEQRQSHEPTAGNDDRQPAATAQPAGGPAGVQHADGP